MPQGKGTYGSKRGRPPKGRYKEGGLLERFRSFRRKRNLEKKAKAADKSRIEEAQKDPDTIKKGKKAFKDAGSGHRGKNARRKVVEEKAADIYKERTDLRGKPKLKEKKFDYRNKMATKMSRKKAVKNAKGRTASEIANDPAFFSNTSKGKYLRGIHKGLSKKPMMGGGKVQYSGGGSIKRKPSTKVSAGNKWN
tara:strand:+ start:2012 stop:2593 length:582 start_codon:yes stop_codon:yes gene_type:complete